MSAAYPPNALVPSAREAEPGPAMNPAPLILVVDDHPSILKLIADVLAADGYRVLTASDALAADAIIQRTPPDLILMDIMLPGMDGLTFTRQLKADPRTRRIRVIALTACAMKGDDRQALAAGCEAHFTKPIDVPRFPALVAAHLAPAARSRDTGPPPAASDPGP